MDPTPRTPAYEQVAALLRQRIYDGTYPPGGKVASAPALAVELGVSVPVIVRAFARLRDAGLVRTEPGSATYVLPRYRYLVTVTVTGPDDAGGELARVQAATAAAAAADPAVRSSSVTAGEAWQWVVVAEAGDPAAALAAAMGVIRAAAGDGRWDLARPDAVVGRLPDSGA